MSQGSGLQIVARRAAVVLALGITPFVAPWAWDAIGAELKSMLHAHYSYGTVSMLHMGLQILTYIAVYYCLQLSLIAGATSAAVIIALRFI